MPFDLRWDDEENISAGEYARLDAPLGATAHELAAAICRALGWSEHRRTFELELFPSGVIDDDGMAVGSGKLGGGFCAGDGGSDEDDDYGGYGGGGGHFMGGSRFFGGGRFGSYASPPTPSLWSFGTSSWLRSRKQQLADLRQLRPNSLLLFAFAGYHIAARVLRISAATSMFSDTHIVCSSETVQPDFEPPLSDDDEW